MRTILFHLASLIIIMFLAGSLPELRAQVEPAVGITEHLDEYLPDGIMLTDDGGNSVDILSQVDKPTVIALVYFNCPGICTPLMDGIAEVIPKTDLELGKDYQVMTISFDPREGTTLASKKKKNYMRLLQKQWSEQGHADSVDASGWRFFTGDSSNIARITDALGFRYREQGDEYMHSGGLILLSPDGKIVRYINKTYFIPFEFKMALTEASEGRSGPTINKLLLYCYAYDVEGGSYVLNVTRVAGVLILFIALVVLGSLVLVPKLRKKKPITDQ